MSGTPALTVAATPARRAFTASASESVVPALVKLLPARRDDARLPLHVAFLVERGPAMEQERRLELAQQAARTILDGLRPDDLASLVVYGERAKLVAPAEPVGDGGKLRRLLGFLDSHALGAGADLAGALKLAGDDLRRHATVACARRLVVLTATPPGPAGAMRDRDAELAGRALAEEGLAISAFGLGPEWNATLLGRLADAGRGGLRHVIRPADVVPGAREELAEWRALAYADVRLRMHFAKGVRLRRFMQVFPAIAHWLPLQPSEREAIARVGELPPDRPCYMLAELVVPPYEPGTYRLATIDASYIEPDGRAGRAAPTELVVTFEAAMGPLVPEVGHHLDAFQVYSLVERALEARRELQPAKALALLENARRIVPAGRGYALEEPLDKAVGLLERGLPLTESAAKHLFFLARQPEMGG